MTDSTDDRPAVFLRADGRRAQLAIVTMLLLVAVAAFCAAIPGLLYLGELAGLGGLAAAVPVVVDGGQIVAAAALAARRTAGRPAGWEAATMGGLVVLSASSQVLHAWSVAAPGQVLAATVMACVLAAALPLTVLAATHSATRAVLVPPPRRPGSRRSTAASTRAKPAAAKAVAPRTPSGTTSVSAARRSASVTAPVATMTLDDAVAAARAGRLSQRQAAVAAGVSRHRLAQELAA